MRDNYEMKDEYTEEIPKLLDSDSASATDTFNPLFQKIINNIHSTKLKAEKTDINALEIKNLKAEVETLKKSLINNLDKNIFIENFDNLDNVEIISGIYDETAMKIYV